MLILLRDLLLVVTCPMAPLSPNTVWSLNTTKSIVQNGMPFGSKIEALCDIGYQAVTGDSQRYCQDSGTWSGSPLNCQRKLTLAPNLKFANICAPVRVTNLYVIARRENTPAPHFGAKKAPICIHTINFQNSCS